MGDDPKQSSPVIIDINETVASLKVLIKESRKERFERVDVDDLTLWGVNICCHNKGEKLQSCPKGSEKTLKYIKKKNVNIENNKKLKPKKLSSFKKIREYFGKEPVQEHIQIIVTSPIKYSEEEEEDDDVDESDDDEDED
ncbi:hypothetical protein GLOIN_2v1636630 [Rhizophagus clarus]|nr:hypothetical protein GLOIN_2v1636630 [Rhizophagus clarus]